MILSLSSSLAHWLPPVVVAASGLGTAVLSLLALVRGVEPDSEAREVQRRQRLATYGRIVDGNLLDAEPHAVFYRYRIAGVTYECSQDVSALAPLVGDVRVDFPVQVRYNHANPADSIVVAESWNGLWSARIGTNAA